MVEKYFKSHHEDETKQTVKAGRNCELDSIFIHLFVHSFTQFSKYLLSAYYVLKFWCCPRCQG